MPANVGSPAPEFTLPDQDGVPVSLASLRGSWVVVYFYPKDDTPGCTAESCSFRDSHEAFTGAGAKVIGISSDSVDSHRAFATKHSLPFTLLADEKGEVAKAYDSLLNLIVFKMARRNTFLIAPDGTLSRSWIGVDPKTHADELVQTLRALQAGQVPAKG